MTAARSISDGEFFAGAAVGLRLVEPGDCTPRYVAWLNDPQVNRYLETRWTTQDEASVAAFVAAMRATPDSYLFAIVECGGGRHVGNLKIGPISRWHGHADLSYFLGERSCWGRGYASDAIASAVRIAFTRLGLHRLQAGVYAGNVGSCRALAKNGFALEGTFRDQLVGPDGREDHLWYGLLRSG
ncbi:MAG TPA: GNAT family protein [Planctomycetota bacterium]|nr:GNAT family protein [Planctomycetota bacterium]